VNRADVAVRALTGTTVAAAVDILREVDTSAADPEVGLAEAGDDPALVSESCVGETVDDVDVVVGHKLEALHDLTVALD